MPGLVESGCRKNWQFSLKKLNRSFFNTFNTLCEFCQTTLLKCENKQRTLTPQQAVGQTDESRTASLSCRQVTKSSTLRSYKSETKLSNGNILVSLLSALKCSPDSRLISQRTMLTSWSANFRQPALISSLKYRMHSKCTNTTNYYTLKTHVKWVPSKGGPSGSENS